MQFGQARETGRLPPGDAGDFGSASWLMTVWLLTQVQTDS